MSDHPDLERRLAAHLPVAADAVADTESVPPADVVRRRGLHLRRRRQATRIVGALAAVGAMVVAVSLVAGNLGGGTDELTVGSPQTDAATASDESSDSTDRATDAATDSGDAAADGASAPAANTDGSPLAPTIVQPAPSGWSRDEVVLDRYGEHLVAWGDGIARISTEWSGLPIAPMSDEMIALFADEVREFFADGLPATFDEGYGMLLERPELLDEVERVMAEHPEVAEHIYGGRSTPTLIIETTLDGRTWSPAGELGFPDDGDGWVQYAMSTGDRLVAVMQVWPDHYDAPVQTLVASSIDLSTWDTIERLEPPAGEPIPAGFRSDRWIPQADLGPDGTLLLLMSDGVELDIESLLSPELLERTFEGYGMHTTDEGVHLTFGGSTYFSGDDGDATAGTMLPVQPLDGEEILLTWDELGIDPEYALSIGLSRPVLMWRGPIGSLELLHSPPTEGWILGLVSLHDGGVITTSFADDGRASVWYSPDGREWLERQPPIPTNTWVNGVARIGDGIVLTADGPGGPRWWRADATGTEWIESPPIRIEGADTDVQIYFDTSLQRWHPGVGHVAVVRLEPTVHLDWSIESDGYRFETSFGPWPTARLVRTGVDGADDEVVFDVPGDDPAFYDLLVWDDIGVTLNDPETGAPLVTYSHRQIEAVLDDLTGGQDPYESLGPVEIVVIVDPDGTGESWFELDRFSGDDVWASQLALADGLVLISLDGYDGTSIRSYRLD